MQMISWLFNFIPWYAYVVAVIVLCCIFWQTIAPIWLLLPRWLKITLMFAGMVFAAYVAGRNRGSKDERQANEQRDAKAEITRETIHENIDHLDRAIVDKRLDRWMRD